MDRSYFYYCALFIISSYFYYNTYDVNLWEKKKMNGFIEFHQFVNIFKSMEIYGFL